MLDPVSLLVGSIIVDLGKGALEDYVKDFLKDRIKDVEGIAREPFAKDAVKEAVKAFCEIFLNELKEKGVDDGTVSHYQKPLFDYIRLKAVKQVLSSAFLPQCSRLDLKALAEAWQALQTEEKQPWVRRLAPQKFQNAAPILFRDLRARKPVPGLPEDFNWERVGQQYLAKVKAIVRDNEELRKLLDSDSLEATARNTQEMAGIIPDCDLAKYAETIKERYAHLKLESLDVQGSAYNELKLWQMFIPQNVRECREYLPQVYELPKDFQRRLVERGELEAELTLEQLERYRNSYREQSIRSVSELLQDKRNSYVVVLGDPGSGKSTLLQYIALEWAEKPLVELPLHPIPILIELRTYIRNREAGDCKTFLEFIHQSSGWVNHLNQHQLVEELKAGNAIALFDGLDEIFDRALREDVISQIHNFTQKYSKVRIIVTSRVIGYKAQRLRDAGFSHFMLQDLDEKQIEDFIQRWHDRTYQNEGERNRKQERLRKAVKSSKAIRELAGNPLLLTMMAILNRNRELPRDREELYSQASQLLLYHWDIERQLEDRKLDPMAIDYRDKQAMLRRVAYKMQASEKGLAGNIIEVRELEAILTEYLKEIEVTDARTVARLLIQQLRERNFILCSLGADYYAFVHRTFLEYFCAWAFVWEFKETRTLTLEALKAEVFGQHWREEAWHEVLRLICGMLDARFVGEILQVLIQVKTDEEAESQKFGNAFLAASCLLEVRDRGKIARTDEALRKRILALVRYDLPYPYNEWDEDGHRVSAIHTQAIETIAATWRDRPDTLLWLKQSSTTDKKWYVRQAAVEALAQHYQDDLETLPILKQLATADEEEWVRQAAVESLAQHYQNDPETLPWLKQRATSDKYEGVRQAAVQALAQHYQDDPETLPILKQRATTDEDGDVRRAAVEALAQHYPDDLETLPILQQRATTDENEGVRQAAVQALAQHYQDDPETLPILQQRATTDEFEDVRRVAVEALAQHYQGAPETLLILKQRATIDEDGVVLEAAVQALAQYYQDDLETLPWLKQRAKTDENWFVRQVAMAALARYYRNALGTLSILKQHATTDEDGSVRRAAVQALAEHYQDDPQTLPILQQRATTDEDGWVREVAVEALARYYNDAPGMFELFCNCTLHDPFVRENNWENNPRQTALEALIARVELGAESERDANSPDARGEREPGAESERDRVLAILRDRADNDPDEKVREFARRTLAK